MSFRREQPFWVVRTRFEFWMFSALFTLGTIYLFMVEYGGIPLLAIITMVVGANAGLLLVSLYRFLVAFGGIVITILASILLMMAWPQSEFGILVYVSASAALITAGMLATYEFMTRLLRVAK